MIQEEEIPAQAGASSVTAPISPGTAWLYNGQNSDGETTDSDNDAPDIHNDSGGHGGGGGGGGYDP